MVIDLGRSSYGGARTWIGLGAGRRFCFRVRYSNVSRDFGVPWTGTRNSIVMSIALRITANTTSLTRMSNRSVLGDKPDQSDAAGVVNYFAVGPAEPNP